MSESVAAVSSAKHEAQAQSGEIAVRLTAILTEAHEAGKKLTELKDALEMKDRETSRRIQAADAEIRSTMRDALAQSSDRVAEITRLTTRLEGVANRVASSLDSSDYLFEDDDKAKTKRVYESYGHKE